MKIIGIVVEYNPLHNGHVYHLSKCKTNKDDLIVAVMSSNVCNRGEISVFNKFDKTALALKLGVDLVIELPFVYSCQSADIFAYNAISLLKQIKASQIIIGSEYDNVKIYDDYLKMEESTTFKDDLKFNLNKGNSFKTSYNLVATKNNLDILKSNDTLGLFYYKAIKKLNANIELKTIKRINNDYLDTSLTANISSATAIRSNTFDIVNQVPSYVYELYEKKGFMESNKIFNYLVYKIVSTKNINDIFMCEEGIENLLKNITKFNNLDDFVEFATSKRYTKTRINRILLNILFDITKQEMNDIKQSDINFIRVLGFSNNGKVLLNNLKKEITIYTNIKEGINNIFDTEFKIDRVLDLIYNTSITHLELKGPIIVNP